MNLNFLFGLGMGYLAFTEDGKKITNKFMDKSLEVAKKTIETGKKTIKETFPETTKSLEAKDEIRDSKVVEEMGTNSLDD